MVPVVFNVGAIAGAAAAKRNSMTEQTIYIHREPERVPDDVGGMVTIREDSNISISQDPFKPGVCIRFRGSEVVNRLIEDLTRLRDEMLQKETERYEV